MTTFSNWSSNTSCLAVVYEHLHLKLRTDLNLNRETETELNHTRISPKERFADFKFGVTYETTPNVHNNTTLKDTLTK